MTISEELLSEIKQYLRIEQDWTEDDTLLSSFTLAAKAYIKIATGITIVDTDNFHKLALFLFVAHQYEQRQPLGKADKLSYSLDSILFQLSYGSVAE